MTEGELMERWACRQRQADSRYLREVRAGRDEHASRFGYDVTAILRDLRAMQDAFGSNTSATPRDASPHTPTDGFNPDVMPGAGAASVER